MKKILLLLGVFVLFPVMAFAGHNDYRERRSREVRVGHSYDPNRSQVIIYESSRRHRHHHYQPAPRPYHPPVHRHSGHCGHWQPRPHRKYHYEYYRHGHSMSFTIVY